MPSAPPGRPPSSPPATGTFRHGSQLHPSPSQSPQERPKANRTRLTYSPEAPALSAGTGVPVPTDPPPLARPLQCTKPAPAQGPPQAALLQAPPFHSTAEGTRARLGPGEGGLGPSRACTSTGGSSVVRGTRVPHSDSPRLAVHLSPALAKQKTGSAGGGRADPSPGLLTGARDLAPGLCPQPSTQGGPGPQPTRRKHRGRKAPVPSLHGQSGHWATPDLLLGPSGNFHRATRGSGDLSMEMGHGGGGQETQAPEAPGSPWPRVSRAARELGGRGAGGGHAEGPCCSSRKSSRLRPDSKGRGAPPHCVLTSLLSAAPTVCRKDLERPSYTGLSAPQGQPGPAPSQVQGSAWPVSPFIQLQGAAEEELVLPKINQDLSANRQTRESPGFPAHGRTPRRPQASHGGGGDVPATLGGTPGLPSHRPQLQAGDGSQHGQGVGGWRTVSRGLCLGRGRGGGAVGGAIVGPQAAGAELRPGCQATGSERTLCSLQGGRC